MSLFISHSDNRLRSRRRLLLRPLAVSPQVPFGRRMALALVRDALVLHTLLQPRDGGLDLRVSDVLLAGSGDGVVLRCCAGPVLECCCSCSSLGMVVVVVVVVDGVVPLQTGAHAVRRRDAGR